MITFDSDLAGQTIQFSGGEFEIVESLTIDASVRDERVRIDAQQQSRIFNITAAQGDFSFHRMTMTGGKAAGERESGGAILSSAEGTVLLSDIAMVNNHADSSGGGVSGNVVMIFQSAVSDNSTED